MARVVRQITASGVPLVAPADTPTYYVWRLDTGAIVANAAAMTAINGTVDLGLWTFEVTTDPALEYGYVIDADPAATGQVAATERYAFGAFSGITDARIETDVPAVLVDTAAIDARLPSDPADESLQQAAHAATQAAVAALNDLDPADVQAALTAQGYTTGRAPSLDNLDAAVSSRSSHSAADVDTVLTASHGAGSWATASTAGLALEASVQSIITTGGAGPWTTATGFAVPGDAMALTPGERTAIDTELSNVHGAGSWTGGDVASCVAGCSYASSSGTLSAEVYLVRNGVRVATPTSATIDVYDAAGAAVPGGSGASASPDGRGVFSFSLSGVTLTSNVVYTVDVSVTDGTGTVSATYALPVHA